MGRNPMNPPPASRSLAAAAALCTVLGLGACKTTTTGNMRPGEIGTAWEKRTKAKARLAMDQLNAAANGDDSEGYMANEYDQGKNLETKSSLFGKKYAEGKSFRTKSFSGTKEFKGNDYHFLKRQEFDATTSPDQDSRFAAASTESPDAKKQSIWQRKRERAGTKKFAEAGKTAEVGGYRDTELASERLQRTDLNIVEDDAREDGATMSVDDVRFMLHGED